MKWFTMLGICLGVSTPAMAAPVMKQVHVYNSRPSYLLNRIQREPTQLPAGLVIAAIDPMNVFTVQGESSAVEQFEQMVQGIDRPVRQYRISSRFVLVNHSDAKQLGFSLSEDLRNGLTVACSNPRVVVSVVLPTTMMTNVPMPVTNDMLKTIDSLIDTKRAIAEAKPNLTVVENQEEISNNTHGLIFANKWFRGNTGLIAKTVSQGKGRYSLLLRPPGRLTEHQPGEAQLNVERPRDRPYEFTIHIANLEDGDTLVFGAGLTKEFLSGVPNEPGTVLPAALTTEQVQSMREKQLAGKELLITLSFQTIKRLEDPETLPHIGEAPRKKLENAAG